MYTMSFFCGLQGINFPGRGYLIPGVVFTSTALEKLEQHPNRKEKTG